MCLSPCTDAIAFSILRATSVSSCAGAAPGSEAVTVTVGRSMSGKFCTFMPLKARMPPKVSNTNTITAGMGLRMDQEETLITGALARRVRYAHEVAVVQEPGSVRDDHGVGRKPRPTFHSLGARDDFEPVARDPPRLDLDHRHP